MHSKAETTAAGATPCPDLTPGTAIRSRAILARALAALAADDRPLRVALQALGPPPLRWRGTGFPALVSIILGQQVSLASATALRARLLRAARPLTPGAVLDLGEDRLRAIGLSRQKADYVLGLATEIADGRLNLQGLARMSDGDAQARLMALKGIGRWSAEVYLLFALGRPDIWPADDLAVQDGVARVLGLSSRPDAAATRHLGERWRPWRSAAARLMWHTYGKGQWERS
ncbi:MAG: DNA-3-methyladenine glycosylase 2 family protein [Alphaproteobacteria bacterium]